MSPLNSNDLGTPVCCHTTKTTDEQSKECECHPPLLRIPQVKIGMNYMGHV